MTQRLVTTHLTTSGDEVEVEEIRLKGQNSANVEEWLRRYHSEQGSVSSKCPSVHDDDEAKSDGGSGGHETESITQTSKFKEMRSQLGSRKYFQGGRLTALDQCVFLQTCIDTEAWVGKGSWSKVKAILKTTSSTQQLKALLEKLIASFKSKNLRSLKASGVEENYELREFLCQEIIDIMSNELISNENTKVDGREKEKSSLSAKQVRHDACSNFSQKSASPTASNGGKKLKLTEIANKIHFENHVIKFEKIKLERDRLSLEMLRKESQREYA